VNPVPHSRDEPKNLYPTEAQQQASLAELTAEFDRRPASPQDPQARDRIDAVMKARGETKRRPKAGDL